MMINGRISETHIENSLFCYSLAGTIASRYSTYRDSLPKIYLFEDYSFDYIYARFLSTNLLSPIARSQKDILVSLCFNPFFEQLYIEIKRDLSRVSDKHRKRLYYGFLKHYSLNSTKTLMETEKHLEEKDIQEIYVKHSAYEKCNELIDLFGFRNS